MAYLQHACTHCCVLVASGNCFECKHCSNFQFCDKCFETGQKHEDTEGYPISQKDKHILYPSEIKEVPHDTKDEVEILESEFCHLAIEAEHVTTCNICHVDIEAGEGWQCEVCSDYDVCNACYQIAGGTYHPHKLTYHPSSAENDAQNKEARQRRVLQLRKMLDLLVHASQCRFPHCQYPNCRKIKGLFRHGIQCKIRVSGDCVLCKKMWYLLTLHARACKDSSDCHVPRCRDLKEHLRWFQQQSDSRRRAAVMEMMRQHAEDVASSSW